MALFDFTESQIRAWDYTRSAIEQGLSQRQALSTYREAGGHIGNQQFNLLWRRLAEYRESWDKIKYFSDRDILPENLWGTAPRAFEKKYVAEVKFVARVSATGERELFYRYVESNRRLSKQNILEALTNLGRDYTKELEWKVEDIIGINLYKRG